MATTEFSRMFDFSILRKKVIANKKVCYSILKGPTIEECAYQKNVSERVSKTSGYTQDIDNSELPKL